MSRREAALLKILGAGGLWSLFHLIGGEYQGWALRLGTHDVPAFRHVLFWLHVVVFGASGAALLAAGLAELLPERRQQRLDRRRFVVIAAAAAFLVPALIRLLILRGAPLADDESVYRFSAELLASGRLSAPSHQLELFFDHAFVYNDGQVFTQYFLGWPALMAPFELVGIGGFANAALSAATVPALYGLLRLGFGERWARLGVLLFLVSPMLQMGAATRLSHTSALLSLTWAAYAVVLLWREPDRRAAHGLLAVALSVAFFIRPLTAVGVGLPFGCVWLALCLRHRRQCWPAAIWFVGLALVFAGLFFAVNTIQSGSPLATPYASVGEYAEDNAGRFAAHIYLHEDGEFGSGRNMRVGSIGDMAGHITLGLVRINFAMFGWFCSLLFLPLAFGSRVTRLMWASAGTFLFVSLPVDNAGIDSFGPVHLSELALPIIVLTVAGIRRLSVWLRRAGRTDRWARAAVYALIASSLFLYVPYRYKAVAEMASVIRKPLVTAAELDEEAIIFVNRPISPPCHTDSPRHFVFWWPMNDPDLENRVLWANHLDLEADRRLLEAMPDRRGYLGYMSRRCEFKLIGLDEVDPGRVSPGRMRLTPQGWEEYTPEHPPTGEVPPGYGPPPPSQPPP